MDCLLLLHRSKYGKDSFGIAFVKASCPKGIDPADVTFTGAVVGRLVGVPGVGRGETVPPSPPPPAPEPGAVGVATAVTGPGAAVAPAPVLPGTLME